MAGEIVVLYDNLTIQRASFANRASLKQDRVMAMAISHLEQPDTGLRRKRQQAVIEFDFYIFAFNSAHTRVFLGGYDAADWGWFSTASPWIADDKWILTATIQPPWFPTTNRMIFKGSQTAGATIWDQARSIYFNPDGPLF